MRFEQLLPVLQKRLRDQATWQEDKNRLKVKSEKWTIVLELDKEANELIILIPLYEYDLEILGSWSVLAELHEYFFLGFGSAGYALDFFSDLECGLLWRRFRNIFEDDNEIVALWSKGIEIANHLMERRPEFCKLAKKEVEEYESFRQMKHSIEDGDDEDMRWKMRVMSMLV